MKLASFDIFDTTLIRKCGLPENVFYLLAHRLFPEDAAKQADFLLWRKGAEARARKRRAEQEVTLADIYEDEALAAYGPDESSDFQEAERAVEAATLVALPSMRRLIEQKRAEGYTICFISDMYLDSAFLANILRREGCLKDGEQVYVSCEHGARKSNGTLFNQLQKKLAPERWEHYGDHPHSDVKMPRRKGIQATQLLAAYTEVETLMLEASAKSATPYRLSILAGLSRAARCLHDSNSRSGIAADFVAPTYIPYVSFILQDARRRGIKKLYFLSRDSYVLMKAAEEYKDEYPEIELRYLFVSRKALLLPYMKEVSAREYLAVQDHGTILRRRVDDLLAGMGTSRVELDEHFQLAFPYEKIYSIKEQEDFLEKIFGTTSPYLPEFRRKIEAQHALLLDYFKQEGLLEIDTVGMVDVGWLGTSRHMINTILDSAGGATAHFYYYGVRQDVMPWKYGAYSSFYSPEQLSTTLTALVENYFSVSPYPSTLSYVREGEKVTPAFAKNQTYRETPLTHCHCSLLAWMLREMKTMRVDFSPAFHTWARLSLAAITDWSVRIDWAALADADDFDSSPFVRKLILAELMRLACAGQHVPAFDCASRQLSGPRAIAYSLWKLHGLTARLRRLIYLKFC